MANKELLETIRKEIISRIDKRHLSAQAKNELVSILSFLSTLESERHEPYNPVYDEAYLNEKIKKATESWKGVDVDAMLAECRGYDEEKSEKPMNQELEAEIDKYREEHLFDMPAFQQVARHFAEWGAEHARNQMMKEAVEGTITCHNLNRYILVSGLDESLTYGDKVRIIICKKED